MTITNAIKGLKHVIQHKEKFIADLDVMTKDWTSEWAKSMIDVIKDSVTKDWFF